MVIEGEQVQAHLSLDGPGATAGRIDAFSKDSGFVARQPPVVLFIDLEVRMIDGPVLVGHEYRIERELVALGQSRRTESF